MDVRKRLIICIIVFLVLILPTGSFLMEAGEEGNGWHPANLIGKSDLADEAVPDEEETDENDEDRVNYYELLFTVEKDPGFCPGEKTGPEPEPEPEPEPSTAAQDSTPAPSTGTTAAGKEQEMVNYINQARSNAGLPALRVNSSLTAAARAKSKDMAVNNYFSHNSPTYGSFTSLLRRHGVRYRAAAENIAWNSNGSVRSAHNNLMNSPGHRRNILGRSYQQVGVGIYVRSDGRHYYTQLFIGN